MNKEIEKKIEDWKFIQNLAFDVLKMLSDEQLGFTVGKNMGTLGEQFRHMARVRFQYAEAIETKKVDNVIEKIDPEVAKSKCKLIELWEKANQKLLAVLQNANSDDLENTTINWKHWGVDEMNIHDHFNALMDHETLHNGQIIVYLRTMELKFPKSWETWGL
ncbi:MAG TPA: DinB family protein [Candidatus Vogelbacteria bacterium]|nr:DinB family protein [Candidatus Vogelbacteria bacterium]